jgi:hypothetical protein
MGLRHKLTRRRDVTPQYEAVPGESVARLRRMIAEQAFEEVMNLRVGQRLVVEIEDVRESGAIGPRFTVVVERADACAS